MTTNNINAAVSGLETVSGEKIGRDPRRMTTAELNQLGHSSNSVLAAVRANCVECCGGQTSEVRKCTATHCALWAFRMGTNPFSRRVLTEEQRDAMRVRAQAARAKRSRVAA